MTLNRILYKKDYWINIKNYFNLGSLLNISKKSLVKNIIKIKTKNSLSIYFRDIEPTESLARILGHILGDGGIHIIKKENKYRAFYVNNENKLLNSFKSDIEKIFGKGVIYFRRRENRGDEIWLPSTIGYLFYKILNYGNLKEKRVPYFIFNSNKKLICKFLQALYDDEGYLYPQKNMIVISQKNIKLLEDIRDLVKKVGINPNKILIHHPKNRTKMHYFSITSKDNIISFYKKINFLHPIKKNKLEILKNKYGE
jgi:hypothetical protein